jgi:hypothetical protein
MPDTILPLVTDTPGLLNRVELARYLNVGRNEIPAILRRFAIEPVAGRFPWRSVWRQVLRVEPHDEVQEALLRQQLQKIGWVAAAVQRAPSTVRRRVADDGIGYPAPAVDLGDPEVRSRSRRWIPALILAHQQGRPLPVFRIVEPIEAVASPTTGPGGEPGPAALGTAATSAFAEILRLKAASSREQPP